MARGSANNVTDNRTRSKRSTPTQEIEKEEETNAKETKPAARRKNAAGTKLSKTADGSKVEQSGETSFAENEMELSKKNKPTKAVGRKKKIENLEETSKEPELKDALEKRSVKGQVKKLKAEEIEESSQNLEVGSAEEVDMSTIHDESSQNSNKSDTLRRTRSAKRNDDDNIKEQKDTKDLKTKGKKNQFEIKTSIVDDASQDSNKPAKSGPAKKTRKAQQISGNIIVEEKESILDEVNQIVNADKNPDKEEVVDRSSQDSVKPVKTRNTRRGKKVKEINVEMGNEEVNDIEMDNLVVQDETDTAATVKIVTRKTRNAKRIENDANDDTSQDSVNITKSELSRKTRRTAKTEVNIDADSKDVKAEDKHFTLAEEDREHVLKTNIISEILDDNSLDSIKSNQSGITKYGTLRRTRNSERDRDNLNKQNSHIEKAELCSSEDMESSSDANCILKDENLTESIPLKEVAEKGSFKDLEPNEKDITNDNMPEIKILDKTGERKNNGEEMEQSTGDVKNVIDEKCAEKEESYRDKHQINNEERLQNLKENLIASSKSELLLEENDSVEDFKMESAKEDNEFSKSGDVLSHQENILNPPTDLSVESPTHDVQESVVSFKESNIPMDEGDSYQTSSLQTNDECDIDNEKIISGNKTFVQSSNQADNSDTNHSETEAMSIEEATVGSSENIDHGYSANILIAEKSEKANIDIDVCSDKTEEASVANFELESSTTDSDTGNLIVEENVQDDLIEANGSELPSIVGKQNVGDSSTVDNDKLNEKNEDKSSVKISTPVSEPSVENTTCANDNGAKSLGLSHVEDADFTSSIDKVPTFTTYDTKDNIDNSSNVNKINFLHSEHIDASTSKSTKLKSLQSGITTEETEDNVATISTGDVRALATNAEAKSENANEEPKQELYMTGRNSDETDSSPVETETPSRQQEIDSYPEEKNIDSVGTQKNRKRKKSSEKEESPDIEISKGGKKIITTYEVSSNFGDSAKGSLASEGDGRSEGSIGIKIKRKRVEEIESDHNAPPSETLSVGSNIHEQTQQLFGNFQSEPGPSGTQQPTRKSSRKRKQDSDQESRENPAAPIRMYLEKFVPFLLEGLLKITYVRPEDPIQYLADWMKENKEAAYTSILKREQASEE